MTSGAGSVQWLEKKYLLCFKKKLIFVNLSMSLYSFEILNKPLYWVDAINNINNVDHDHSTLIYGITDLITRSNVL